jgi:hypothetical protein
MKAASLLTKMQLLEQPPDQVSELQDRARSDGALLWHLYLSLDQHCHSRTQCRISSQLVALLTHENSRSSEVIRRCFPAGLLNDLPSSEITFDECGLAVQRGVSPYQGLLTGGACGTPTDTVAQTVQASEKGRGLKPMPSLYAPTDMGHGPGNNGPAQSGSGNMLGNMLGMGGSNLDDGMAGPGMEGQYHGGPEMGSKVQMAKQKEGSGMDSMQGGGGGGGAKKGADGGGGQHGSSQNGGEGSSADSGGEKGMRRLKIAVGPMDGFDAVGQLHDGSTADSANVLSMGYRLSMAGATVGGELYLAANSANNASSSSGGSLADAFQRGGFGGSGGGGGGSPANPKASSSGTYDGGLRAARSMIAAAAAAGRSRGAGRSTVPACKCVVLLPEFFDRIRLPRIERPDLLWSRPAQRELCHRLLHEVHSLDTQRRRIASALRRAANAAEEVADEMRPMNGSGGVVVSGQGMDDEEDLDDGYESYDEDDANGYGGYDEYVSYFDGGYDDYGSGFGGNGGGSSASMVTSNKSSRSDPLGEAWATVEGTAVVWNDSEFEVHYSVLAAEVRVGRFYIRTLLEPLTGHLRCPEGYDREDDSAADGKDSSDQASSGAGDGKGAGGDGGKPSAPTVAVAASAGNSPRPRETRLLDERGGGGGGGNGGGGGGGDSTSGTGGTSGGGGDQPGDSTDNTVTVRINASAFQYNPLVQDPLGLMQLLYFRLTVERAPDVKCLVLQVMTQLMVAYGRFGTYGLCSLPFLGALVADARTKIRFITKNGSRGNDDDEDGTDFPLGVRGKLVAFLKHALAEVEYVGEWLHASDYNSSPDSEQSGDGASKAGAASAAPAVGAKPSATGVKANSTSGDSSDASWAAEVERQVERQLRRHLPSGYGISSEQADGGFDDQSAKRRKHKNQKHKNQKMSIAQVQSSQRHRIERLRHAVVWEGNCRRFIGGGGVELLIELMVVLAPEVGRAVVLRKERWKRAALDRRRRERALEAEKLRLLKAVADATNTDYRGAAVAEAEAAAAAAEAAAMEATAAEHRLLVITGGQKSPTASKSPVRGSPSAPRGIRISSPNGPPPAWLASASADGLTATCLATLLRLVTAAPSVDPLTGAVLLPVPAIKRKLCQPQLLRGLVDVIGAGDEGITRLSVWLLQEVLRHHEEALPSVFKTGLFLQLLRYEGSSLRTLLPIAELLHLLHLRQALDSTKPLALAKPTPLEFDERHEGDSTQRLYDHHATPSSPYLTADGSALYDTSPQNSARGLSANPSVNVNAMGNATMNNANVAAAGASALLAIANRSDSAGGQANSEEAEAMRLLQEMEGGPTDSFVPQFGMGGGTLSSQQHEHGQYVGQYQMNLQPQQPEQPSLTQGNLDTQSRPQLAQVNVTRTQLRAQAAAARKGNQSTNQQGAAVGGAPKADQGGNDMQDGNQALQLALTKSVLRSLLPTCMVMQLLRHGPLAFARAFAADASDPEVIWSQAMRSQLRRHIVHFMDGQKTSQEPNGPDGSTDILVIPPMDYEEDAPGSGTTAGAVVSTAVKGGLQQLQCHGYFLRQLLDESRFARWPIPAAGVFLRSLTAAVRGWMSVEEETKTRRRARMMRRLNSQALGGLGTGEPMSPSSPGSNSSASPPGLDADDEDDATGAKHHRLSDGDVLLLVRTMGLLFRRSLRQANGAHYSGSPTDPTAGYGTGSGYVTLPSPLPGMGGGNAAAGTGKSSRQHKRRGGGGSNLRLISARQMRHFVSAGPGAMRKVLHAREAAAASAAKAETRAQTKLAKANASGSDTDAASAKKALAKAKVKTLRLQEMLGSSHAHPNAAMAAMAASNGPQAGFVYPLNDGGFSGYTTLIRAVQVVLGDLALQSGVAEPISPPSKTPNHKRLSVSRELLRRLLELLATSMALHRPHPYFRQLNDLEEEKNPTKHSSSSKRGSSAGPMAEESARSSYANASACAAVGGVQCVAEVLEALAGDGLLRRDTNETNPTAAAGMAGFVDRAAGAWSPLDVRDRPAAAAALTSLARLLGSKEGLLQAQAIEEAAAVADTAQRTFDQQQQAGAKSIGGGPDGKPRTAGGVSAGKRNAGQPTGPDGQPMPTQRLVHHVLKLLRLEDPYHDHELQRLPQKQQQHDCPAQDVASAALECVLAMARAEAFARPPKTTQAAASAASNGSSSSSSKGEKGPAAAESDDAEEGNCFSYITLVQALNAKGVAWHLMPWLLAYPSDRDYDGYAVGTMASSASSTATNARAAAEGIKPSLAAGQPSFDPLAGARRRGLLAGEATMLLLGRGPLGPVPAPPNIAKFTGPGYGGRDQEGHGYGGREYERYERNVLGTSSAQPTRDMSGMNTGMGNVQYNVYVSCGLRNSLTMLLTSGLVTVLTTPRAADKDPSTLESKGVHGIQGYRAVQAQVHRLSAMTLCSI